MKEYEIFVSASYSTDGTDEQHYNCFKEYVRANSPENARRALLTSLTAEGYNNIEMDEPIEVK